MKRLNSYLEDLQKKNPVNPTHLMFYLKNGSEQEEGKPNSVHIACKQALRMGYSEIYFRLPKGAGERQESLQWSLHDWQETVSLLDVM